jgi:hypothetical protein
MKNRLTIYTDLVKCRKSVGIFSNIQQYENNKNSDNIREFFKHRINA